MACRVYYTDVKLPSHGEPNYNALIPLEFDSVELSISKAIVLIENQAVVWRIECSGGVMMNRADIETEYWRQTGKRPAT